MRGVRKVSEAIVMDGRSLIVTEPDDSKLNWGMIPDGTLKIDPETGEMSIKIAGESSWLPAGLKNDGTITIAKDAKIVYEVFTIKRSDNGDGTFTYTNGEGNDRTKPLTVEGFQTFELEKGTYVKSRNKIEVIIDDTLHRSAASGGLIEIDEERIALTGKEEEGTEVTVKYVQKFNVGTPYPRFYMGDTEPERKEYGDFWLDTSDAE